MGGLLKLGGEALKGLAKKGPAGAAAADAGAAAHGGADAAPANAYQPGGAPDPGHLQRGDAAGPAAPEEEGPTELSNPAANRFDFQRYKDELRAQMEQPAAEDPGLSSMLGKLYRPNAKIGSGSTAAAVRHERETGGQVGGRDHTQKAGDNVVGLQRWLKNNPTARPGDRAAAENVMIDMQNALGGS